MIQILSSWSSDCSVSLRISCAATRKSATSGHGTENVREQSWEIGESKFAVEGTTLAVTLFGTETASASGARWEIEESGKMNVVSARCCDCCDTISSIDCGHCEALTLS